VTPVRTVFTLVAAAIAIACGPRADAPPERGERIELIAPPDRVGRDIVFEWTSPVRADQYRLVVLDSSNALVWAGSTRGQRVTPGSELWMRLKPSLLYRWSVEGVDAGGRTVARSAEGSFTYAPSR
jgi:hypothetical protein